MDPNSTLRELMRAMIGAEMETVGEAFDALRDWTRRGGFAPSVVDGRTFNRIMHRAEVLIRAHEQASDLAIGAGRLSAHLLRAI